MPKTKISEFSATPANNTDIDSINIAEGCAPSGINDAIRELMAQLKDFQVGSAGDPVTVGGVLTVTAGTAALPAITTAGDTNTGIFFPAADTIAFAEGGAEAMRLDSAGNVGIGTSSLEAKLQVAGGANPYVVTSSGRAVYGIDIQATAGGAGAFGGALSFGAGGTGRAAIAAVQGTADSDTAGLAFFTHDSGTSSANAIESARITSAGNLGIGTTSPAAPLHVNGATGSAAFIVGNTGDTTRLEVIATTNVGATLDITDAGTNRSMMFAISGSEKARIDSSGNLLVGKTSDTFSVSGARISSGGVMTLTTSSNELANFNRLTSDGALLYFSQDSTIEGSISVSGTTVSYNGGHLSRWAQTTTNKDDSIVKGTVLSNLDEMNVYTKDGLPVDNEQLNKVKVSDTEGDANVAGVFVNWTHDEDHNVDEINMAMTGDMIIRIAQGTTVQRGDLLMSAGDGTAKPQGDDIVRSKTVAKVTSTHVTCTYADGSYCVPCVLMAC